ncbi:RluA family pseudouridine synthase [Thiomicrospira microaerophila]|uniref:RluA family pseudouridine synthase n=1 Tax=Thiomicrospira microaerophila TaxID=406020 RepID=UPI00200DD4CA|nr:RluA family pseudouridine synthase [Thiomicrospira microaerophila]UQB42774.1 RluA family pseudouridine synthase [Thiomicrospira microaerophila]
MSKVRFLEVTSEEVGQRLDNFLLKHLRKVPKMLVYRIIRKGEVRVNKGRAQPSQRLVLGDLVRVPPVAMAESGEVVTPPKTQQDKIEGLILYEDDDLLVINKPSGMAVHGGSGVSWGLVELVRNLREDARRVELVHRLDRDTSGAIILAKKMSALRSLHEQIRQDQVEKRYVTLLAGQWPKAKQKVDLPLLKNTLRSGERMVEVSPDGKPCLSYFFLQQQFKDAALMEVKLVTGRTHQIRVHARAQGCPVIGDEKYGFDEVNKLFKEWGMARLALHAKRLVFKQPSTQQTIEIEAPLFGDFTRIIKRLEQEGD